MLPRLDILLRRIREESDTVDDNSLKDNVLTNYVNDAQRTIQNVIFQADQLNNVFTGRKIISAQPGVVEYDLPDDVYAENSIISVWTVVGNSPGQRYDKQGFGEASLAWGYSVQNRKIILNHSPQQDILVIYNYRLPLTGLRVGGVTSVASQIINLDPATLVDGFDEFSEYVTIVDKKGVIIVSGLYIESLVGPVLTVEGDTSLILPTHFVVPGKYATTHSCLPEEVETFLKTFVQRKVLAHINSKKLVNTDIFSMEERQDIADLFADKHSDIEYPMIVDHDYLDY